MKKQWFVIQNCIAVIVIFCTGLFVAIPLLFIAALPARWRYNNRVYYFFSDIFYKGVLWGTGLPISVYGKEHLLKEPSILIANHQSSLDILLLGSLLDRHPHVWLFLARFAKIPFFGFIARRMNVVVDHSKLRKLVGSIDEAIDIAKFHNSHIIIFPEGGRYTDGTIHKFYYGFAILAKATQRPIIPIIIRGADKALPPYCVLLRYNPISITVGNPVRFGEQHTQDEIVSSMQEWFSRNF